MNKIKQLEVKKLLKELDFVESDFNYKNEIVSDADHNFIRNVNELLDKNVELKDIFDNKFHKNIETIINKKIEEESIEISDNIIIEDKPIKLKKLYRDIVKATHPDKVTNKKLNDLYIKATRCYSTNDIAGTYSICDELDIEYEVDEEDNIMIIEKINKFKERISFMEQTLTWKWYHNENERDKIMMEYLKNQLG